jgi:hypothetical protein
MDRIRLRVFLPSTVSLEAAWRTQAENPIEFRVMDRTCLGRRWPSSSAMDLLKATNAQWAVVGMRLAASTMVVVLPEPATAITTADPLDWVTKSNMA